MVDGQGSHLQVFPVDGSGSVVASTLGSTISLRLPEVSGTPQATSAVSMKANLYSNAATPTTTSFDRFDPSSYNYSTSTTIYDSAGNAMTMSNYFVRTQAPTAGDPTSKWEVHSYVGDAKLTQGGSDTIELDFNGSNALTSPTTASTFDAFQPNASTAAAQTFSLNFGTATAQSAAPFSATEKSADGKAVGQIEGVTIGDDGTVKASFSNGDVQTLGKVALAKFSNPSGLRQLGSSYWSATGISGEASLGQAASSGFGNLMTGTIERSNVDITEELVGLISAQRNFQANAKALDTASQTSQTILNIQT